MLLDLFAHTHARDVKVLRRLSGSLQMAAKRGRAPASMEMWCCWPVFAARCHCHMTPQQCRTAGECQCHGATTGVAHITNHHCHCAESLRFQAMRLHSRNTTSAHRIEFRGAAEHNGATTRGDGMELQVTAHTTSSTAHVTVLQSQNTTAADTMEFLGAAYTSSSSHHCQRACGVHTRSSHHHPFNNTTPGSADQGCQSPHLAVYAAERRYHSANTRGGLECQGTTRCHKSTPAAATELQGTVQVLRNARYGLRAQRLGEAKHPGPTVDPTHHVVLLTDDFLVYPDYAGGLNVTAPTPPATARQQMCSFLNDDSVDLRGIVRSMFCLPGGALTDVLRCVQSPDTLTGDRAVWWHATQSTLLVVLLCRAVSGMPPTRQTWDNQHRETYRQQVRELVASWTAHGHIAFVGGCQFTNPEQHDVTVSNDDYQHVADDARQIWMELTVPVYDITAHCRDCQLASDHTKRQQAREALRRCIASIVCHADSMCHPHEVASRNPQQTPDGLVAVVRKADSAAHAAIPSAAGFGSSYLGDSQACSNPACRANGCKPPWRSDIRGGEASQPISRGTSHDDALDPAWIPPPKVALTRNKQACVAETWQRTMLIWTFTPPKQEGSTLEALQQQQGGTIGAALQNLAFAIPEGAKNLKDMRWDLVVNKILCNFPGPVPPQPGKLGSWEWARGLAPWTMKECKRLQEVGSWALDYCNTELAARKGVPHECAEPQRSSFLPVGNGHVFWRMATPEARQHFNSESIGNVFEAAATVALAFGRWHWLHPLLGHIQYVQIHKDSGEVFHAPPHGYLDTLRPANQQTLAALASCRTVDTAQQIPACRQGQAEDIGQPEAPAAGTRKPELGPTSDQHDSPAGQDQAVASSHEDCDRDKAAVQVASSVPVASPSRAPVPAQQPDLKPISEQGHAELRGVRDVDGGQSEAPAPAPLTMGPTSGRDDATPAPTTRVGNDDHLQVAQAARGILAASQWESRSPSTDDAIRDWQEMRTKFERLQLEQKPQTLAYMRGMLALNGELVQALQQAQSTTAADCILSPTSCVDVTISEEPQPITVLGKPIELGCLDDRGSMRTSRSRTPLKRRKLPPDTPPQTKRCRSQN